LTSFDARPQGQLFSQVYRSTRDGMTFQELTGEAFKDVLKEHDQPVGLKAALKESVGERRKPHRPKS